MTTALLRLPDPRTCPKVRNFLDVVPVALASGQQLISPSSVPSEVAAIQAVQSGSAAQMAQQAVGDAADGVTFDDSLQSENAELT